MHILCETCERDYYTLLFLTCFFLFLNKIMFFIILHKYKEKYINLMNDEINLYINSKIQNS